MPRISVIMPCYNAAASLAATLSMLTAQTFADWEAVCVDDGSTDDTRALLEEAALCDPRIRVVSQPNSGPAEARNLAARIARGEVLAFLDADDLWSSDRLTRLVNHFDKPDASDAVYGKTAFFSTAPGHPRAYSTVPGNSLKISDLLGENPVCTMSNIAVRAMAFEKSGGFDSRMVHAEDLEWLIRLVASGAVISGNPEILTFYRASAGGLSANLDAMHTGWQRAVETACLIDRWITPQDVRKAEAIHLRYLGRRALRMDAPPSVSRTLVIRSLRCSPRAFFSDPRRGVLIFAGAVLAPLLPRALRSAVFAN